jgi:UDP-N-acetylmuramate dehydrogenase
MTPERNAPLAAYTSLRVGGPAEFFLSAQSAHEVIEGFRWARDHGVDARVIGGGTNLLVADAGVAGLVIKASYMRASVEEHAGGLVLVADAGVNLTNQARRLAKQNLSGLEWAANVPGTVGGAVVNNAGAFGGDTASCLLSVTLVDARGHRMELSPEELHFDYRTSLLKRREMGDVAVETARLRLFPSLHGEADARVKEFNAQRMRSQPRIKSAGSVFANPEGNYSGKLIEEAGLKGTWAGGAQISEQHANFIVNRGAATARDVYTLMRQAQEVVFVRAGIWLKPEIELFGRWDPDEIAALSGPAVLLDG